MAAKTAKQLIKGALADLSQVNFEQFLDDLLDREEEPRVKRNQVEDKTIIVVTDVLVSTFTDTGALAVVVELLMKIDCHKEAKQLEKEIGEQSPVCSPGAEGGCTGADFVDEHIATLIDRVNNIGAILDELFQKKVITHGVYVEISAIPTTSNKMRQLYYGALHSAGPKGKEVFYKILERTEIFLIDDLKKKK